MIPNINPTTIALIVLSILLILVILWVIKTEQRLKKLLHGKKALTLEDTIINIVDEVKNLKNKNENISLKLEDFDHKIKKSIQKVKTIRFNPFKDSGGTQSFAISFLDENGDGVVLSSLYARERMSVFAKPIKKYSSEYELTEEERESLSNK